MVYAWEVLAMLGGSNREVAWNNLVEGYTNTQWGNTISNAMWFIATQPE